MWDPDAKTNVPRCIQCGKPIKEGQGHVRVPGYAVSGLPTVYDFHRYHAVSFAHIAYETVNQGIRDEIAENQELIEQYKSEGRDAELRLRRAGFPSS